MTKFDTLRESLKSYERVVIGFDGSAAALTLAQVADEALGHSNALCIGVGLDVEPPEGLNFHAVVGGNIMQVLSEIAIERNATVVLAVTLEELTPEHEPLVESGARLPLVEAGFSRQDAGLLIDPS